MAVVGGRHARIGNQVPRVPGVSRLCPSCSSIERSARARKDSSAHFPMGEPRRLAFILFYSFRSFDRGHSDIMFAAPAFTLDQTLGAAPCVNPISNGFWVLT